MQHLILIALFASLATASLLLRRDNSTDCRNNPSDVICTQEYLASVCAPHEGSADIDLDAPCNIFQYVEMECVYGQKVQINNHGLVSPTGEMQSNNFQRLCICENHYFDAMQGCQDCISAHGGEQNAYLPSNDMIESMSSAYCATTATPTLSLGAFQTEYLINHQANSPFSSTPASATSTFSDPIGNKTEVSLYWTPPISGSKILDVGQFTGNSSVNWTFISDGQIVATVFDPFPQTTGITTATQAVETGQTSASPSAGTTTTSGIAVRQTQGTYAGVLGLVGIVAVM